MIDYGWDERMILFCYVLGDVSKSDTWLPLSEMQRNDFPHNACVIETKQPEKNGVNNNGDQPGVNNNGDQPGTPKVHIV